MNKIEGPSTSWRSPRFAAQFLPMLPAEDQHKIRWPNEYFGFSLLGSNP
jgi:hypothetical protein